MLTAIRPPSIVVRTVPWNQALPVLALSVAPAFVTAVRGQDDFDGAVLAWLIVAGATVGYAFDEPARTIADPTATSNARRIATRFVFVVLAVIAALVADVALVTMADGSGLDQMRSHAAVAFAVAGISAAAASGVRRRGARVSPGEIATGPLAVLVISSLAFRYSWLPTIADDRLAQRWWIAAGAGCAFAVWNARDACRR